MSVEHQEPVLGRLERVASCPSGEPLNDRWCWRPSARINSQLPAGFAFNIRLLGEPDRRRIAPADGGWDDLVPNSWAIGLAVLEVRRNLEARDVELYRLAWFLSQKATSLRPYLRRQFHGPRDLLGNQWQGRVNGRTDFIPAAVDGRSVTVSQLLELGRAAAADRGEQAPGVSRIVHLGLFALAQAAPLYMEGCESVRLVRSAIFDWEMTSECQDEALVAEVSNRFCDALAGHLGDTTAVFNAWLTGRKSGLLNQLAKRKTGYGPVSRQQVSAALVEIGFRSMRMVAECIAAGMTELASCLNPRLTAEEWAALRTVYGQRPYLGGLSLPVMRQRCGFLREALIAVWNSESPETIGVLQRMLMCYATMASDRRESDRERKRRPMRSALAAEVGEAGSNAEGELADEVAESLGARCPCVSPTWSVNVLRVTSTDVRVRCECLNCGAVPRRKS